MSDVLVSRLRSRDHRGVISLLRPSDAAIDAFRARMRDTELGYPEVGATRDDEMPAGYHVDRSEELVGEGEADFAALSKALARFRYYDAPRGRIRIVEPRPPLAEGEIVVLLGRHLGIWTLSACRIVYTFDEPRAFAHVHPCGAALIDEFFFKKMPDVDFSWAQQQSRRKRGRKS